MFSYSRSWWRRDREWGWILDRVVERIDGPVVNAESCYTDPCTTRTTFPLPDKGFSRRSGMVVHSRPRPSHLGLPDPSSSSTLYPPVPVLEDTSSQLVRPIPVPPPTIVWHLRDPSVLFRGRIWFTPSLESCRVCTFFFSFQSLFTPTTVITQYLLVN